MVEAHVVRVQVVRVQVVLRVLRVDLGCRWNPLSLESIVVERTIVVGCTRRASVFAHLSMSGSEYARTARTPGYTGEGTISSGGPGRRDTPAVQDVASYSSSGTCNRL